MASYQIKYAGDSDRERWDSYVQTRPDASFYHLFGWRDAIHRTYGHDTHYLMAVRSADTTVTQRGESSAAPSGETVGILPLVHLKSILFGNCLVSMPFVDGGGVLAENKGVEETLLSEAIAIGQRLGADKIELRSERAIASCDDAIRTGGDRRAAPSMIARRSDKVRMLLKLPQSSGELVKSFRSKLRSQVNRPLKEGCTSSIGGLELLEDFYKVFLINMRDLGSPVHSKQLMRHVLEAFPERSRFIVVYSLRTPIASALITGFNGVLRNPWASSDRKYAAMSPNMLLYLRMLEFGCDNGYRVFDFGRSTPGEGTYRFKEQWGAAPAPLHWYLISLNGKSIDPNIIGTERFEMAARCWRRLPLVVTKVIGPRIRKQISL